MKTAWGTVLCKAVLRMGLMNKTLRRVHFAGQWNSVGDESSRGASRIAKPIQAFKCFTNPGSRLKLTTDS